MSQLLFQEFQPLAAIATTPRAVQTLQPLCQLSGAVLWVPDHLDQVPDSQTYRGSLKALLADLWADHQGLIFGLATGAVVRLISPLLNHKSSDPAIVVVDEAGDYIISLCSGHQGGADRLTRLLASGIGASPVLTGAAAASQLPGIDVLGQPFGWQRGEGDWTRVSAAVARQETVQVIQEAGSTLWQSHLPPDHPFCFSSREESSTKPASAVIWIGSSKHQSISQLPTVHWHPRVLWVGIGCERGTSRALMEQAIHQVFQAYSLEIAAIAGVASLDLKADEQGLVNLCQVQNWPLRCFPAATLREIPVPTPAAIVAKEVGTPSVAEAAAIQAARQNPLGDSQSEPVLQVSKQIIRSPTEPGAVTVAVAQAEIEFTGRIGNLLLVGTGPGSLDQITPAAQTAVTQADAVIGYSLYIDLLQPLLRPGQVVEPWPITQERQRVQRAIALATWGLTVAVVSSGDCGIYGMAGLVFEELQAQGWNGKVPNVQVFPGVSALQAAAARVGAPLMHDFCAISLSNLLTPWEVIEKRLIAAAQADFVTAIYNPRSQSRQVQVLRAQEIFLQHRSPNTPVAIVRSAYRQEEQVTLTTLGKLLNHAIDMLTIFLIGNQSTRQFETWLITPRGYLGLGQGNL